MPTLKESVVWTRKRDAEVGIIVVHRRRPTASAGWVQSQLKTAKRALDLRRRVPAQWPVRSELFQVALAISFYTVAVTPSRITAFVAATLAAAGGQCGRHDGWLAPIYEVDRGSS